MEFNNEVIPVCRKLLKDRLLTDNLTFRKHEAERTHVLELIRRTVEMGESNSALIIGPRGSGKTVLLNSTLADIQKSNDFEENVVLVELNGLLHTDDQIALKAMTRQMKLENVVEDKVFGTFAENLTFLLQCLKMGEKETSKPIVVILDEFDLFCSHRNQTLLYNLLDVAQSAQAPLCVLGLTCRLDVIELLEKRVKSRFSHRQIFLFHDNSFEEHLDVVKWLLMLPGDFYEPVFLHLWNEQVLALLENAIVKGTVKKLYCMDKSESTLKKFLFLVVSQLDVDHPELQKEDFTAAYEQLSMDSKTAMLEGLSVLELSLVIAMKHLNEIYDGEPFNFQMVYDRYQKFCQRHTSMPKPDTSIAMKIFEHLEKIELIQPVISKSSRVMKEYQLFRFLVSSEQIKECVKKYHGMPTEVAQWATSSFA